MKKSIKYVKIKLTQNNSQEFNIISIEKIFLFNIKEFEEYKNIEEIRDHFINTYEGEFVYDYLEVETYKSIEDSKNNKFIEHIGE